MSINGIIPEVNEFFEVSMNPDESFPNSSFDFEVIQMEKARSNVNRLIEDLIPGFHATEIPKGQLISKCPFCVFKSPQKPTTFFPSESKENPSISGINYPYLI